MELGAREGPRFLSHEDSDETTSPAGPTPFALIRSKSAQAVTQTSLPEGLERDSVWLTDFVLVHLDALSDADELAARPAHLHLELTADAGEDLRQRVPCR